MSDTIKLVELREIFYKMLQNYINGVSFNLKDKNTNNESLNIYSNIILTENLDKEDNHDSLQDILNLLAIIRKEKFREE
jgi:hypothetical protein